MSLFGTIQIASNSLNAAQLGLQVTGNNIANANTPDYIRQRLIEQPAVTARQGDLLLGLGVQVTGVQQVIDKFLDERARGAASDVASSGAQAGVYTQLESAINELGDQDLSTQLTGFFGSLQDVLNQPDSVAARNVAVQKGQSLTDAIQRLDGQVRSIHNTVNQEIVGTASDINNLLTDVAKLNLQIVQLEGGGTSGSDAVGLRDRRADDLNQLAQITDIKVLEQPTGDVTVYSGGDYLVSLGTARTVGVVTEEQNGLQVSHLVVNETHASLSAGSGSLGGLTTARDNILQGFISGLNDVSKSLINDFNKVYSGGQGLTGFSQTTSDRSVTSGTVPLDTAGLPFPLTSGTFQIQTSNKQSSQTNTTDIHIDLAGLDTDTTLQSLATQIDAINGISATVTNSGQLQITSDSPDVTFAFSGDNSGALAALGINTFFSGTGSQDIGVSQLVKDDPGKMTFSSGGVGVDSTNGALLANFLNAPAADGGASLSDSYQHLVGNVALASQSASAASDGFQSFQQSLDGQRQAISGVNIDEEAVRMIEYQRTYQASAKVISTINDMIQTLLNL
ncbi:MAG TPA: flagellar hook-associated protein FlgK [Pirellulaceae bacterium]|jgi:flagellar hook-associated protein 1 FlgK